MADDGVVLPGIVRRKAEALGELGRRWLAELDALIAELAQRWHLTVGVQLRGGTTAYVAQASTVEGRPVVLKIGLPDAAFRREMRAIVAAAGKGYVELLDGDLERHAMLLERLGPSLDQLAWTPEHQLETLCALAGQAWRVPRGTGVDAEPAHDKGAALHGMVTRMWSELDHPCPEAVVAQALQFADRRSAAFAPELCVMVHGDPAPPNALQVLAARPGAEAGAVFVDPDGFFGDPAYDLGVMLRDWCPQLLAGDPLETAWRYCRLIARNTGMDATAIWEWGFLERVSTGLYALSLGAEDLARPMLATAAALVVPGS